MSGCAGVSKGSAIYILYSTHTHVCVSNVSTVEEKEEGGRGGGGGEAGAGGSNFKNSL